MFIVEKDGGETVVAVALQIKLPYPDASCKVHDVPGWDWSLADFTGVDRTQPDWLSRMRWDGKTLVGKTA